MPLHPSSRPRVERLLRGPFQNDDLRSLFLAVRDLCDNRQSVKEIGNFTAHQAEKDRGFVTDEVRDFFIVARFQHPWDMLKNPMSMPANAADYFPAAFERLDSKIIRADTGMGRKEGRRLVSSIVLKLHRNPDGTMAMTANHSAKEMTLAQYLLGKFVVRPAFTAERLFEDFQETLRSNGLLQHSERRDFQALFAPVALFAVHLMHGSVIQLPDGSRVPLAAGMQWGKINVQSHIPMPPDPRINGSVSIATNLFGTDLIPEQHCEPELLPPLHDPNQPWPPSLEVNANRKLARL